MCGGGVINRNPEPMLARECWRLGEEDVELSFGRVARADVHKLEIKY